MARSNDVGNSEVSPVISAVSTLAAPVATFQPNDNVSIVRLYNVAKQVEMHVQYNAYH